MIVVGLTTGDYGVPHSPPRGTAPRGFGPELVMGGEDEEFGCGVGVGVGVMSRTCICFEDGVGMLGKEGGGTSNYSGTETPPRPGGKGGTYC